MKKSTTVLFAVFTVVLLGLLLLVYYQGIGNTTGTATTDLTIEFHNVPESMISATYVNIGNTTVWAKVGETWMSTTSTNANGSTIWVFKNITSSSNCYDQLLVASRIVGFEVDVKDYAMGTMVTKLAAVENDEFDARGWQYYVNGIYGNKASNLYSISNGDSVRWDYLSNQAG
jgi:hypothetical protein